MDMQMLVEQQGETINQIEEHAETTAIQMEEGNTFVKRAISSARATRHVSVLALNPKCVHLLALSLF
jgi:syntaxin 1B/2/3